MLGDMLGNRHILDKPRDARRNMDMAVQSSPIEKEDVGVALGRAIKSKERKRQSDGAAPNLCLVLLNALDLDIGGQSTVWEDLDLTPFDAVVPSQWLLRAKCRIDIRSLIGNLKLPENDQLNFHRQVESACTYLSSIARRSHVKGGVIMYRPRRG